VPSLLLLLGRGGCSGCGRVCLVSLDALLVGGAFPVVPLLKLIFPVGVIALNAERAGSALVEELAHYRLVLARVGCRNSTTCHLISLLLLPGAVAHVVIISGLGAVLERFAGVANLGCFSRILAFSSGVGLVVDTGCNHVTHDLRCKL